MAADVQLEFDVMRGGLVDDFLGVEILAHDFAGSASGTDCGGESAVEIGTIHRW